MSSCFELITRSRHRPERLFTVSLSIDAHLASMSRSGERAVACRVSGDIGLGETVTWRARHFCRVWTMTSGIEELSRGEGTEPWRFVDAQVSGPFRSFRHEHLFEPEGEGTVMRDRVSLASPVLGGTAEPLLLVPYVRRLLRIRNRHLLAVLG